MRRAPRLFPLRLAILVLAASHARGEAKGGKLVYTDDEMRTAMEGAGIADSGDIPIPFAIDDEIRHHVDALLRGYHAPRERARRLLIDIFGKSDLAIAYSGYNTKTANEVFRVRRANCLGYTNLYVGMTRYAGLRSYYVEVSDLDDVKLLSAGQAVLVRGHICAGVEVNANFELYDFSTDLPKRYKRWRRISDREAMAAFLNNRGVEELFPGGRYDADGRPEAEALFRAALAISPGYAPAANNLASAFVCSRDLERARSLYASIRSDEPRSRATILANIGTTYFLEGDPSAALSHYQKALGESAKDPFILERIGVAQEALGHLAEAIDAYQRAAAFHGRFARPHLALGRIFSRMGDARRATREYRLALDIDGTSAEARDALQTLSHS